MINITPTYAVVLVDEVDISQRLAHCADKTGGKFQVSFRNNPAGILTVPAQGERWLAIRAGTIWYFDKRLDAPADHEWAVENMVPGDMRVRSSRVRIGGPDTQLGAASTEKVGFWGHTPVVQPIFATGAGHTVDDVIAFLQSIGLCRQS